MSVTDFTNAEKVNLPFNAIKQIAAKRMPQKQKIEKITERYNQLSVEERTNVVEKAYTAAHSKASHGKFTPAVFVFQVIVHEEVAKNGASGNPVPDLKCDGILGKATRSVELSSLKKLMDANYHSGEAEPEKSRPVAILPMSGNEDPNVRKSIDVSQRTTRPVILLATTLSPDHVLAKAVRAVSNESSRDIARVPTPAKEPTTESTKDVQRLLQDFREHAAMLKSCIPNDKNPTKEAKKAYKDAVAAVKRDLKVLRKYDDKEPDVCTPYDIQLSETLEKVRSLGLQVKGLRLDEEQTVINCIANRKRNAHAKQ